LTALAHPSQHTGLTDEQLLLAYRTSGESHWLGYLLQRYTVLLLGVAVKYLKDRDEAQDAVQQIFLKAITHLPAGEIQNFKGWLYILMRNHCLQLLRDKSYKAPEEVLQHVPAEEAQEEAYNYTPGQMSEALSQLNSEQQTCVVCFYLKKMSYQQIMEQTGFSFAQVKSYIQNGKRNLKMILSRKAGTK
jgi:RNA polymerase sigma-70 factor (ECF subfamily)